MIDLESVDRGAHDLACDLYASEPFIGDAVARGDLLPSDVLLGAAFLQDIYRKDMSDDNYLLAASRSARYVRAEKPIAQLHMAMEKIHRFLVVVGEGISEEMRKEDPEWVAGEELTSYRTGS